MGKDNAFVGAPTRVPSSGASLKSLTHQMVHHGDTLMTMAVSALLFTAIILAFQYRSTTPPEVSARVTVCVNVC